jgi:alkanesulfonate monooxygenase SsuD/methylene tetrahydromethanopterin reductase-like flavin-dependent oxidoreductase (luciferase family)
MKVGFLLPVFRETPDDAFAAAQRGATAGVDGVFAYDHLWPMGSPERPALSPFPVLAAVSSRCPSLIVGPLVARVGLTSADHLIETFRSLELAAPGRVIAAIGTGDKLSATENEAYGIPMQPVAERQAMVEHVANALSGTMPVWIGAGAPATNALAQRVGATLNYWQKMPESPTGPWNWAGNPREDLEVQLDELAAAGSTWAVFAPTVDVSRLGTWRRSRGE